MAHQVIRDQSVRKYCYTCGCAWLIGDISCSKCGSMDSQVGGARPTKTVKLDAENFDGPWKLLKWPAGGSVAMYGGPGSGKSSLASLIVPKAWLSKEQEPQPIAEMWRRICPNEEMPEIHIVNNAEDVKNALALISQGPIVMDSVTALGLRDGLAAAYMLTEWAKDKASGTGRVLLIIQVTSDGTPSGYNEIPHLVDAVVNISPDPWGVRSYKIEKSRWSPLDSMYWGFGEGGSIIIPDFNAAYSVEGTPGQYHLHPYPLTGAKWHGVNAALAAAGLLRIRTASSGVVAPYMESGFVEPMDSYERSRFAQANGLEWISASDARAMLDAAGVKKETKKKKGKKSISEEDEP